MLLPNFLIVGAAKAGTTTLYDILAQHPEIGMSYIKEPNFFSDGWPNWANSLEEYSELFRGHQDKKAIGEASPFYFFDPSSARRIHDTLGSDTKIIIILRNPVDRAYSHWANERFQYAREPLTFKEALEKEQERAGSSEIRRLKFYHHGLFLYYWGGEYAEKVKWFLDIFERNNIKILIMEELIKQPVKHSQDLFRFLAVESSFVPKIHHSNPAAQTTSPAATRFISAINQSKLFKLGYRSMPSIAKRLLFYMGENTFKLVQKTSIDPGYKLDPELRKKLLNSYLPGIHDLERLLNINLAVWYQAGDD